MSLEQIRFALTVFLLQNEGRSVKETFNWVNVDSNQKIDKEHFEFGLAVINHLNGIGINQYRFYMTSSFDNMIVKMRELSKGEVLCGITLNPGGYSIELEDIIKHINFNDHI